MPPLTTFHSPVLSLWQSAINEVLAQQKAAQPKALGESELPSSADAPIMLQSVAAAEALLNNKPMPKDAVLGIPVSECAQLYIQLILAEAQGDTDRVAQLKSRISFSDCDVLWLKVFVEYERFRLFSRRIPYRRHQTFDNFVLPLIGHNRAKVRIALIADWGTGMPAAQHLLAEIGRQGPDILIHLGDIYYSGTSREVQERFLAICRRTPGLDIPIFTLAGNHDMYSGGDGYYWLIDQLGQPASYFCLRNDNWQLLAMDTGLHDSDPGTVISNLTHLDKHEVAWHRHKIANAGGRRTVLLSHHQLFCAVGGVGNTEDGKPLAINPHLHNAFADVLDQVDLWMWGHEHNLIVFDEYAGLARGRCIGSAAVPTLLDQNPYRPDPKLVLPAGQSGLPIMNPNVHLGDNGQFYNHGYAMLTLSGRAAEITYYQIPDDGGSSTPLFEEQIPAN